MEVGTPSWIFMGIVLAIVNTWFLVDNIKQFRKNPQASNKFYIALSFLSGPVLGIFLIARYMF